MECEILPCKVTELSDFPFNYIEADETLKS